MGKKWLLGELINTFLFLGLGSAFVVFSIYFSYTRISLLSNSFRAQGKVIDKVMQCSDDSCSYYSVIKFNSIDGKEHIFTSEWGAGSTTIYIPFIVSKTYYDDIDTSGKKTVFVRYRADDPSKVVVDSLFYIWGPVLLSGGLGVISIWVWFVKFKGK